MPVFHVATQEVSQYAIVWSENGQMAENIIHQRALVGCTLCTEETERGGRSEWDDRLWHLSVLLFFYVLFVCQGDIKMLHRKTALADVHSISHTKLFNVLICYVGVRANIYDFEEIILQFIPMPLTHQIDDFLCYEGLTQSNLVGKQHTPVPHILKNMEYALSCGSLEIFYCITHKRRICLMAFSNEA